MMLLHESAAETRLETLIQEVQHLYERGKYLEALRTARPLGEFSHWPGPAGRVLAARIVGQLGAQRRAEWLFRRAYRQWPQDGEAQYFRAYSLLRRRGPLTARNWMLDQGAPNSDTPLETRASWLGLHAQIAGILRDFDTAEEWLAQALEIQPHSPWMLVCQAGVLESEDRYQEAYAVIERALQVTPFYRPAVNSAGHLLILLNRQDEALQLLEKASAELESNAVAAQLFALQIERQDYIAASRALDRVEELSPLAEKHYRCWLAAQRAEVAYYLDDIESAIRFAQESDSEYHKAIAVRLQEPEQPNRRRVLLPVSFVRQHQKTCVPATLSAITAFWSKPADQLQVADQICYNGTSGYSERKWASENGWETREFSVTEESAVALLDRGIPFTFTTVEPTDSHLQAVIGYDTRRGTLQFRDPFWPNVGEGLASKVLERYRAHGPRGMALVPQEQAAKLAGLELPDAALWDAMHEFDGALQSHRRESAIAILKQMQASDLHHRLALEARRRLAGYDGNLSEHLAVVEELLSQFVDEPRLQLERLSLMRHQVKRDERLAIYERMCKGKDSHPVFWQQYAQELVIDSRRHDDAIQLLNKAIRRWPTHPTNYYILANLYWEQRRFEEAIDLYRICVCLDDKDEQFTASYFAACRIRNRAAEALKLLETRFDRYGKKSDQPARTLAHAYTQLERSDEALRIVRQALDWRPQDGELLLFAAQSLLNNSLENIAEARALIDRARDKVARVDYVRAAARLATYEGQPSEALALWQQVLELQPMHMEAHTSVSQLLAEIKDREAALAHLQAAAERFPHYYPLHELWITWLRDEPNATREPIIRCFLEANMHNAWAHREYALWLLEDRRLDEAWAEAEIAGRLEPESGAHFLLRGNLYRSANRINEAAEEYRKAIRLSVDDDFAVMSLVNLGSNTEERRAALLFVKSQIVEQVITGDGLLLFRELASEALDAEEVLKLTLEARTARPDLWQAWCAVAQQYLQMNRLEEAWQWIRQANERFSLVPRLWIERAETCHARLDREGERTALETALRINPNWTLAVRMLTDFHTRQGDFPESRGLLERAIAHSPLDASLRIAFGELLWRAGEKDQAIEQGKLAVLHDPSLERAWEALEFWSEQTGKPALAVAAARELSERRAGQARSWIVLARLLNQPEQVDERLSALDRAIELNPRLLDAYDLKATTLATFDRYDEAAAACRPTVFGDNLPTKLRARQNWIEWKRGNREQAAAQMRALLEEEPLFYGGWCLLADWRRELADREPYLEAAEALVRLSPQAVETWGFLGDAHLLNGNVEQAIEACRRAFELDPQYEFAGNLLFDHQLEKGDLAGAQETLRRLRMHSASSFVLARATQLAAKQGRLDEATALLRQIATTKTESNWPLQAASEAICGLGSEPITTASASLEELVGQPDTDPSVGDVWVELALTGNDARLAEKVQELRGKTPAAARATHTLLNRWARANERESIRHFVAMNRDWLQPNDLTWGSVGFAFTALRAWDDAASWMKEWRERAGAKPWMLVNAAEALRALGRDAEAIACSQQALEMEADGGTRLHQLLLAADAVCAGDIDSADSRREAFRDVSTLDADYQFLVKLLDAVCAVAKAAYSEKGQAYLAARRQIKQACREYAVHLPHEPARQRFLAAAQRQTAIQAGKWWAWVCHYWDRFTRT